MQSINGKQTFETSLCCYFINCQEDQENNENERKKAGFVLFATKQKKDRMKYVRGSL